MERKYSATHSRGFTLIELLVVIAIIGILSSVIMVSLNIARGKAADSKVKSQLSRIKNAAQLYQERNGDYVGIVAGWVSNDCATPDSMFTDVDSGMASYTDPNNYPQPADLRCTSTNTEYMVSARLNADGEFWCVDSSGNSIQISAVDHATAHPDDDTTCN